MAIQEKNDEQVAYAEFETWCSQESTNLASSIKKGGENIELLTASIDELGSDISQLGDDIAQLNKDEAKFSSEKEATEKQREKDHAASKEEEADFSESVDAIERALTILSKQDYDRPAAAAALVQLSAVQQLPEKAKSIVSAFIGLLDGDKQDADYSPPEANAYEFQSGGIVAMLKKLRDEFRAKLSQSQKEEMNSAHASEMMLLDLTEEIEALRKATEIMQSDDVSGSAEKHLDLAQMQQKTVAALLQAAGGASEQNQGVHRRVRDFLASEGRRLNSQGLALLAQKIMADPFAKVKKMIDGMITRLPEG